MSNIEMPVPGRKDTNRPTRSKRFLKVLFYVAAVCSLFLNLKLAALIWNFKCAEGGYFTTKAKCAELADNRWDAYAYRQEAMERMNADIFEKQ